MDIKDKIKKIRIENEFSQKQFAAYLGVSYSTLQKYEYGITKPSNEFLYNLSEKFHINPKELVENDSDSFDFFVEIEKEKNRTKKETIFKALNLLLSLDEVEIKKVLNENGTYHITGNAYSKIDILNIDDDVIEKIGEDTLNFLMSTLTTYMKAYEKGFDVCDERNKVFDKYYWLASWQNFYHLIVMASTKMTP